MEELRSTEALDKEILEDARKKANRLLRSADDTVASAAEGWKKKTEKALEEIRAKYKEQGSRTREEVMARLPLDKRRARSEYIEQLLENAMDTCLSSLDRKDILAILKRDLDERKAELPDEGLRVVFRCMDEKEADSILSACLPKGSWSIEQADPAYALSGRFPELVINAPDLRVIASVDRDAEELLQDKRAELISALLGTEAIEEDPSND
ncbi:ATPase [Treponema sp. OttesenSCG-928-L16]|nr:ATPase [Treponema sp. OttesenSCG-928-L16]